MKRFTQLYFEIDSSNRTLDKLAALKRYFAAAPPEQAAWALYFLTGNRIKRAVSSKALRQRVAAEIGYPDWLLAECYDAVGDLAETLALLLPNSGAPTDLPLDRLVEERLLPLPDLPRDRQGALLARTWRELDSRQRLVWHKLITGEFRVGVARTLVARAVAQVAGVAPEIMAHRLMAAWRPTADDYLRLLSGATHPVDAGRPYPFFLAYALDVPLESLGDAREWQAEWKWDGIRAQLLKRNGQTLVWSRGEELVTDRFPEVAQVGEALSDGTVLDGEILAWRGAEPLSFNVLQRRIGRKRVGARLLATAPVAFMAYDILEQHGEDIRELALAERNAHLDELVGRLDGRLAIRRSERFVVNGWQELAELHRASRERRVEGLMLKRLTAAYGVGRVRGDWWKWKSDPHTIDAVLIHAQLGHGRRASLFTDYTFGVWHEGELTPVAKAYSGLTDADIREVDQFVRANTIDRAGPVRFVKPELVFELAFEGIQASTRHKSGIAVRFPRMARWRHDKQPQDADTLDTLRAILAADRPPEPPPERMLFD